MSCRIYRRKFINHEKHYVVILLVLFAGLIKQAQTNVSVPVDTTLHLGLNTYVQPGNFLNNIRHGVIYVLLQ